MDDIHIAMALITLCIMLTIKLGYVALVTLKAKYIAKDSINALDLLKEDKRIDMITNAQKQAVERLSYKVKRDKLLSNSRVIIANAIAENN
jgi:hypothetical protein